MLAQGESWWLNNTKRSVPAVGQSATERRTEMNSINMRHTVEIFNSIMLLLLSVEGVCVCVCLVMGGS